MRIKWLMIVLFIVTIQRQLLAQNYKIDSLNQALEKASSSDSITIYHSLAIEWASIDNNQALAHTHFEYDNAIAFGDSVRILKSLRLMGQILRRMEKLDSAEVVLTPLIQIAKRHNQHDELLFLYTSLGGMNLFMGRYDRCLKFYTDALNLPEIDDDPETKRVILFNTGLLYYKIYDMDRALEYNFKTLPLLKNVENMQNETAQLLLNISLCYIHKRDFAKGEYYLKQGLSECGGNCNSFLKMHELYDYGTLWFFQDELEKAENFFLRSYDLAVAQNDERMQLDVIGQLADIYLTQKRFHDAERCLAKADLFLSTTRYLAEAEVVYGNHVKLPPATFFTRQFTRRNINKRMIAFIAEPWPLTSREQKLITSAELQQQNLQAGRK